MIQDYCLLRHKISCWWEQMLCCLAMCIDTCFRYSKGWRFSRNPDLSGSRNYHWWHWSNHNLSGIHLFRQAVLSGRHRQKPAYYCWHIPLVLEFLQSHKRCCISDPCRKTPHHQNRLFLRQSDHLLFWMFLLNNRSDKSRNAHRIILCVHFDYLLWGSWESENFRMKDFRQHLPWHFQLSSCWRKKNIRTSMRH